MKKLLLFFTLLVPFAFTINVNAEELEYQAEVDALIEYAKEQGMSTDKIFLQLIVDSQKTLKLWDLSIVDDIIIDITNNTTKYTVSLSQSISYSTKIPIYKYSITNDSFSSSPAQFSGTSFNISANSNSGTVIYYSYYNVLNSDGSVYFEKNYPLAEEEEPEPTPTPTPTPTPIPDDEEIDISDLEKCDSFICNITEQILDGFNLEGFDFLETIINFLLILFFDLLVVSPFILIFKIARWF